MGRTEVAGFFIFSHIRIIGYFRLGKERVNECPAGLERKINVDEADVS